MGESLITFLLYAFGLWIIIRHFWNTKKPNENSGLDRLIREKKSLIEKTKVIENPLVQNAELKQLEVKLGWGVSEILGELNEYYQKNYHSELKVFNLKNIKTQLILKEASDLNDFYFELLKKIIKNNFEDEKSFEISNITGGELNLYFLISINQMSEASKKFNGNTYSLSNLSDTGFLEHMTENDLKQSFFRIEEIKEKFNNLFVLNQNAIERILKEEDKKVFHQLSLKYHPDKINLKCFLESERERLENIYNEHFQIIKNAYEKKK